MPFPQILRSFLLTTCSENSLQQWFDPLNLSLDSKKKHVLITFPHQHFKGWFSKLGKQPLENSVTACLGSDYRCEYRTESLQTLPKTTVKKQPAVIVNPYGESCTFQTFMYNNKNDFPFACAKAVSTLDKPKKYNPLIIQGKQGTGKTHLLKAIANQCAGAGGKVFYTQAYEFYKKLESPQSSFLTNADLLIVDNIHLLPEGETAAAFFRYALPQILQQHCQVVFSVLETPENESTLAQRYPLLLEGIIVSLSETDLDVRSQYLHQQNISLNLSLRKEQIIRLAQRYRDIRSLKGVISKIKAYQTLMPKTFTHIELEQILHHASGEHQEITLEHIIQCVARTFKVPTTILVKSSRKQEHVYPRQIAMYLCRKILDYPFALIGKSFGDKDHSTVMHAIKKIEHLSENDHQLKLLLSAIKTECFKTIPAGKIGKIEL